MDIEDKMHLKAAEFYRFYTNSTTIGKKVLFKGM